MAQSKNDFMRYKLMMRPDVAQTVTRKLFIPPFPADRRASESLNVAMATGVVCAEFRRRGIR